MRYSAEHKQKTRQRILEAASREFKRRGFAGAGVEAVMKAADLTHGGFYAHFKSKDELVTETLKSAFEAMQSHWAEHLGELSGPERLTEWIERYLSPEHRDHPEAGCPAPPLAAEIARARPETRAAFTSIVDGWAKDMSKHTAGSGESARARTLAAISLLIGAMTVSRAVDGGLSDEIREAARAGALALLTREDEPPTPEEA